MGWATLGAPLFYWFRKRLPEAPRQSQPSALIYLPRHEWTGDPGPLCRSASLLSLRPAWCDKPELRPWRWGAAGGGGEEHRRRRRRTRGCRAGRRHLRRRYRGDRDASRIPASVGRVPPRGLAVPERLPQGRRPEPAAAPSGDAGDRNSERTTTGRRLRIGHLNPRSAGVSVTAVTFFS